MAVWILDVHDVEWTRVTFPAGDDPNTAQITTSSNHTNITRIELNEIIDLSTGNIDFDGVVGFNQRVRVANGTAVVKNEVGDFLRSLADLLDAAQLVLK